MNQLFSKESLLFGGTRGIFDACAAVLFGVGGCTIIMNFGPQIENPKRNIPKMTIITFICAFLAFGLVAFVGSGVAPLAESRRQAHDLSGADHLSGQLVSPVRYRRRAAHPHLHHQRQLSALLELHSPRCGRGLAPNSWASATSTASPGCSWCCIPGSWLSSPTCSD